MGEYIKGDAMEHNIKQSICSKLGLSSSEFESLYTFCEVGGFAGNEVVGGLRKEHELDADLDLATALHAKDLIDDDELEYMQD